MEMYIALDNREFETANDRDQHNKNIRARADNAGVPVNEFLGGIKVRAGDDEHDRVLVGEGMVGEKK